MTEHGMDLGREIHTFRASPLAVFARAARGPIPLLAGMILLALEGLPALEDGAMERVFWGKVAFAVLAVAFGVLGLRGFLAGIVVRLHVHQHGFVLRSLEGSRAALWEAVREIRVVDGRLGAVSLRVRLIHGEHIEIVEDVGELTAVETCLRSQVGEKFCE